MISSLVPLFLLGISLVTQNSTSGAISASEATDDHPSPFIPLQSIEWGPCDPTVVTNTALSCGFLEVPLDYHDHSAGKARLALVKANATGERLGTVFFNPGKGGPGISGVQFLDENTEVFLSLTAGRYDIVGWDTRGVGSLTIPSEISCFDSPDEYNEFFSGTIESTGIEMTGNFTDLADIRALFDQASIMQRKYEEVGKRCLQSSSGEVLKYVGTTATARDLAAIADAIDGPGSPVNYYGISYGTLLGSWFINMFPERVGRVVLDGVFNPDYIATQELSLKWFDNQLTWADDIYKGFITGCALAGPEGCAIASAGQTSAEVNDVVQALLKTAHDAARANISVPITSGELRRQLFPEMSMPGDWSNFANVFFPQVKNIVLEESQNVTGKVTTNTTRRNFKRQSTNNIQLSFSTRATLCGDSVDVHNTTMSDVFHAVISAARNVSSMFAAQWPIVLNTCSFWPVRAVERYQGPFDKILANKILVVGNTFDSLTPFQGAKRVAELLGEHAALVRYNSFGHTSLSSPSACIIDLVQAYMLNGTLPEGDETVCEVDETFAVFKGVTIPDILAHSSFNL